MLNFTFNGIVIIGVCMCVTAAAGDDMINSDPATPHYNTWILSDLTMTYQHHHVKAALCDSASLRDGIILLKVWLHQRQLDIVRSVSLSLRFNGHFPGDPGLAGFILKLRMMEVVSRYQNVSILDVTGAKDDGGGGDSWSYKSCKAPVKSSPPTNPTPSFLQARCPSCCPG